MSDRFKAQQHPIDLIMVEDSGVDAELITDALKEAGLTVVVRLVEDEPVFCAALDERLPDAILSDWLLPNFSGRRALEIARERCPDVPLIFVSGTISESFAFEAMRQGAIDYIFKHNLQHLGPALIRALNEAGTQRALRESEESFRQATESMRDAFVVLEAESGTVTLWNAAAEAMFGYRKDEIIGHMPHEIITPSRFREAARTGLAHFINTGKGAAIGSTLELAALHKNGTEFAIELSLSAMRIQNKWHATAIVRDVTEHHKLEEQLRQSQKMESIGILAGGIAHDFNNILSVIIGYGQITLMKMPPDDPNRHNIQYMLDASDRAARLTKDLLLFSRKQACNKKPVNLNDVVAKVGKFLVKVIGEDIEYRAVLHEAPLPVLADELLLEQVLMNLATNAGHAMPNGGALVVTTAIVTLNRDFVAAQGFGKPGLHALLTVKDNGMGMSETTRQQIFEPFFTTKEVGKGTGLGLAVVYGIIKEHEGYITVNSEPGMGATFSICLPLIAPVKVVAQREEQKDAVAGGTETILMAEDDDMVRGLMKSLLTDYGYTVIEALDGADAVRRFAANSETVDLLLLDLVMPKMNGKEAFDEIRKVRPDIKAIFSSGYAPENIRQKVSLADGVHLITKPVSPMELLKKVREVLAL